MAESLTDQSNLSPLKKWEEALKRANPQYALAIGRTMERPELEGGVLDEETCRPFVRRVKSLYEQASQTANSTFQLSVFTLGSALLPITKKIIEYPAKTELMRDLANDLKKTPELDTDERQLRNTEIVRSYGLKDVPLSMINHPDFLAKFAAASGLWFPRGGIRNSIVGISTPALLATESFNNFVANGDFYANAAIAGTLAATAALRMGVDCWLIDKKRFSAEVTGITMAMKHGQTDDDHKLKPNWKVGGWIGTTLDLALNAGVPLVGGPLLEHFFGINIKPEHMQAYMASQIPAQIGLTAYNIGMTYLWDAKKNLNFSSRS